MNVEHTSEDPRLHAALQELTELVKAHYPTATFSLERGVDDPDAIHLVTTVDIDDPDEVVDLTIDRELELQVDEGLPVHVIPRRTPARVEALRRREQPAWPVRPVRQTLHS
jgi:hypothetical protein